MSLLDHARVGVALWWAGSKVADAAVPILRRDPIPRAWESWQEFVDSGEMDRWRWQNFSPAELSCGCRRFCAGAYYHDTRFLDRLQAMREAVGKPFVITSAHRCARWNASVGGAAMSRHTRKPGGLGSIAADIAITGHDLMSLYAAARKVEFTGIGFGASFLHVDARELPAAWGYGLTSMGVWSRIGVEYDPVNPRRVVKIPQLEAGA